MSYKGLIIFGLLAAGCLQGNHNQNAGILTKEILIEENTTQEFSAEENTIEESSTEENTAEESSTEETTTEEPSTGENSSEETSTEEEERIEGWIQKDDSKYYFEDGEMVTDWKKVEGNWYYFEPGGEMATGWKKVGGNWYYLNTSGKMLTDWQQVDGKWYYLNSGGAMLKSTVVQGRVLDSNGEWMVDSKYIASNGSPYYIRVNKKACVVTVYALDENGYYTVPIKSMICSPGNSTPIGTFNTIVKYRWRNLIGNVQGQYSTRIVRGFLFHSVPYGTTNENDLRADYFNRLGEITSAGCVRLQVGDAKWIFDHCPLSTIVQIYENDMPGPFGVPNYIKIPTKGIFSHWDPTDPHQDNPWKRLSDGWNYIEGKWYYCCEDGSIAVNTVIDGYVVGQDGVWIP